MDVRLQSEQYFQGYGPSLPGSEIGCSASDEVFRLNIMGEDIPMSEEVDAPLMWLVGDIFFRRYYSIFDIEN